MKNLIYKELKLVTHPYIYLCALLTALLLIPNFPSAVVMLFFVVGLQAAFDLARTNKDLEFTAMLPVSRNAIVISKHVRIVSIQLLQIIAAILFAVIASILNPSAVNTISLDANFTFFAVTLIGYSVFNIIFLPGFFKSGYKIIVPGLIGLIAYPLTVAVLEIIIAAIPALKSSLYGFNPNTFVYQMPFLIVGIIIYCGTILGSYKLSVKNFEKVSL